MISRVLFWLDSRINRRLPAVPDTVAVRTAPAAFWLGALAGPVSGRSAVAEQRVSEGPPGAGSVVEVGAAGSLAGLNVAD